LPGPYWYTEEQEKSAKERRIASAEVLNFIIIVLVLVDARIQNNFNNKQVLPLKKKKIRKIGELIP